MERNDEVTKDYMSDSTVFADAFNFFIYNGEKVIKPDQLNAVDATEIISMFEDKNKKHAVQRMRDILKSCNIKTDSTCTYILLGIENQSKVHYAMPVRNMLYDALQYAGQVDETSRRHRENRDYRGHSDSELISKKIKKGKSLDEIADEVEEPVEVVKRIIEEKCYAI